MKRIVLLILLTSITFWGFAQNNHPVSWKFSSEKIEPLTYKIKFEATVKAPYHIYPLQSVSMGFGMPTQFIFAKEPDVEFIGTMEERGAEQKGEESLAYYSKGAIFTQIVKMKSGESPKTLDFTIKYIACTDEICLPPSSGQFTVTLNDPDKATVEKKVSLVLGGLPVGTKAPELKVEEWLSETPDLTGKFVALDFWGTHCKPCIAGFAHINELHRKYQDKIAFIATTLQAPAGTPEDVYTFEGGAPVEFYSMLKKSWDEYNVQGIPYMVVIDPKGIIRFSGNGHDLDDETLLDLFAKYGND